jgi:hypothetical protein
VKDGPKHFVLYSTVKVNIKDWNVKNLKLKIMFPEKSVTVQVFYLHFLKFWAWVVTLKWASWVNESSAFKANIYDTSTNKKEVVQGYGRHVNKSIIPLYIKSWNMFYDIVKLKWMSRANEADNSDLSTNKREVVQSYGTNVNFTYLNSNFFTALWSWSEHHESTRNRLLKLTSLTHVPAGEKLYKDMEHKLMNP